MIIPYDELEKHFTKHKSVLLYSGVKRISRKLKKKVKLFCGVHYKGLSVSQRLWYYLGKSNPNYKTFLIKQICKQN